MDAVDMVGAVTEVEVDIPEDFPEDIVVFPVGISVDSPDMDSPVLVDTPVDR
ncbi:MAG TPA: hypothetical protein VKF36_00305 [Syntrophorhabdales bacterium]|nr:hypothetical protein [Syntrophorhabdales bacterium]